MKTDAAVIYEEGGPFTIESVEIEPPQDDEILVEIAGVGFCHTDVLARDQHTPTRLPAVLGHEGAGVVQEVGDAVTSIEPGDSVVLSFDYDDQCPNCNQGDVAYCEGFFPHNFIGRRPSDGSSPLSKGDETISGRFFGQSSFAQHAIATERNAVKVPDDAPLELLGPLGCGIQTGAGGVINALNAQAGSSIVIFGAGSVGLSGLLGANVKGCSEKVVVDIQQSRLEKAEQLGATNVINPNKVDDVGEAIREYLDGGVDYSLEATGDPSVLRQAVDVLQQGGTCGVAGAPPVGTEVSLEVNTILAGREIRGITIGDAHPKEFIPDLIDLYQDGQFPFDELITLYDFENIEQAVEDQKSGEVIKPVLTM
ncbi:NAD(P)-dependent alcohol dehydrogenase [Salinarchaeum sp. IM2453]|uniref:NAD(P)-dependent alcohol dehydrogenase n=1 Tax=Salinarchaeum sp. IM2453 TaxID=2862870 RepID=UPI001C83F0B9|nr:NAD(P)-dependent alcohol dehydrogenase [Salinarchaeum sp. IM2453]QZA88236.1 NAD(P)-dependent alcohol dehydrogenase [Salinarchaeum sp. IM2453]